MNKKTFLVFVGCLSHWILLHIIKGVSLLEFMADLGLFITILGGTYGLVSWEVRQIKKNLRLQND